MIKTHLFQLQVAKNKQTKPPPKSPNIKMSLGIVFKLYKYVWMFNPNSTFFLYFLFLCNECIIVEIIIVFILNTFKDVCQGHWKHFYFFKLKIHYFISQSIVTERVKYWLSSSFLVGISRIIGLSDMMVNILIYLKG